MVKLYKISLVCILFLIACDAAEDLFKETQKPEVSEINSEAGFTVNPNQLLKFWVTANDPDGGQLSYKWDINGGTILGSSQTDTLEWRSPTIGGAQYLLEIEVTNESESTTRQENITVLSYSTPTVNIISPQNNEYIVQYFQTQVKAEVIPNVQISEVQFFVNDSLINSKLAQSSSVYEFTWIVDEQAGLAEIKVKAIQITNVSGADSINVIIEGILPGKTGG